MGSFRIASRYAKSLLDLAKEKGQLEQVLADVNLIAHTLTESKDLSVVMKSPIIPSDRKLAVLRALFKDKTGPMLYQFMELLVKKGREAHLREVLASFQTQYNTMRGITVVKLTTATPIDAAAADRLVQALKKQAGLTEVETVQTADPELIGGFVLQYGDKMIDASVRKQLHALGQLVDDDSYIKKY